MWWGVRGSLLADTNNNEIYTMFPEHLLDDLLLMRCRTQCRNQHTSAGRPYEDMGSRQVA